MGLRLRWVSDDRLKGRCIELVLAQAGSAFFSSTLAGVILIAAFWGRVSLWVLVFWGVSYFFVAALRVRLAVVYRRAGPEVNPDRWFGFYAACVFLSGFVWGMFLLMLSMSAEGAYAAVLMVTFTALLAAAVTAYSVSFPLYVCFSLPVVFPFLVSLVFGGEQLQGMVAAIILCWYLFMVSTARRFSDSAMRSLGYQYENVELVRELEAQNERAERLAGELLVLSNTDALTGLFNRRFFNMQIEKEWARALRTGECLSVVIVDIDYFKGFNDSLGHIEGDKCIALVAGVLKAAVREGTDFAVRYGGEEFALVLANTRPDAAGLLAERLRAGVEALSVVHPASGVAKVVTASFGVAGCVPCGGGRLEVFIDRADKALYRAKELGRNRVELSG